MPEHNASARTVLCARLLTAPSSVHLLLCIIPAFLGLRIICDMLSHLPADAPRYLAKRGPLLQRLGFQIVVVYEELEEQHELAQVHAQAENGVRLVHVALITSRLVKHSLDCHKHAHKHLHQLQKGDVDGIWPM